MITIEDFIKDIEKTKADMITELAVLNGKRDRLLADIGKLQALLNEVKKEEE